MKLGNRVNSIRNGTTSVSDEQHNQLDVLGFRWDTAKKDTRGFSSTLLALQTYNIIYGNVEVPREFVVPVNDSAWPEEVWGMNLGDRVNNIRNGTTSVNGEQRSQLDALGFGWETTKIDTRGVDNTDVSTDMRILQTHRVLLDKLPVPI